ncbi:MAG: ATP-binding cassette domain-containing protein [Proteobacteria bacterium]|jgi:ABC-type lipoprotein export system ATPase subunit|nr:ATP-binding cassette domain-containing protein [Pseudomonadota bacterium]
MSINVSQAGVDGNEMPAVILRLESLKHTLIDRDKKQCFTVNVDRSLQFHAGDFIGLLGPSGCGKTTLLSILGLLRKPADLSRVGAFELYVPASAVGETRTLVDIRDAWARNDLRRIENLRRTQMGFALQSGELVKSLTVTENIQVPLRLNGWQYDDMRERVRDLLGQFSLTRHRDLQPRKGQENAVNTLARSRINRLSGGEYQRVSLARAIAHKPSVVFVDEPTSALNRELAHNALDVLRSLQRERSMPGITFMITHDEELATRFCNVIVRMAPRRGEPEGDVVEIVRGEFATQAGSRGVST